MPYTLSSTNLPSYVKGRSEAVKKKWIAIFNAVDKTDGESKAFAIANTWLKKQVKEKKVVARTEASVERLFFTIDSSNLIKRTDDGEEYISAVLSDDLPYKTPTGEMEHFPRHVLEKWAKQINSEILVGDIDHEEYDKVINQVNSVDEMKLLMKRKPGIAKTVKAILDDGKLWIRALIDKRYKKVVEQAKGLSIEAYVTKRNPDGSIADADLFGFSFGVNHQPVNPRAVIANA
jgi:hypothetical protein